MNSPYADRDGLQSDSGPGRNAPGTQRRDEAHLQATWLRSTLAMRESATNKEKHLGDKNV